MNRETISFKDFIEKRKKNFQIYIEDKESEFTILNILKDNECYHFRDGAFEHLMQCLNERTYPIQLYFKTKKPRNGMANYIYDGYMTERTKHFEKLYECINFTPFACSEVIDYYMDYTEDLQGNGDIYDLI